MLWRPGSCPASVGTGGGGADNRGDTGRSGEGGGEPDAARRRAAKALVDVAASGLVQARAVGRSEVLVEQLPSAITSLIVVEQAKGFVAERLDVDLARSVVTRQEDAGKLLAASPDGA